MGQVPGRLHGGESSQVGSKGQRGLQVTCRRQRLLSSLSGQASGRTTWAE